ncbi:DUF5829 family protein [Pendulispora brunnea]|uniref:DUF5829 family protein n=1 Tax=Pendulispora brunnea TaxID=2905690 RepID=A0ABZ2K6J5_9BACT
MVLVSLLAVLAACSRGQDARPPTKAPEPRVVLNHVVATLDAETLAAIQRNSFIREHLAAAEERTNATADGQSWTGFYLYGRDTSIEFFGPGPSTAAGDGAIGLGVDERGGLERLASRLRASGRRFHPHLVTKRDPDGRELPWFTTATFLPERPKAPFGSWVMEYRPEFMAGRVAGTQRDPNDVSRRNYLFIRYRPEMLVENLRSAHYRMPCRERDEFATDFAAYGWRVRREGDDAVATGPDFEMRLTADAERTGLVELRFALQRKVDRQEVALGSSKLTVGPGSDAVWRFAAASRTTSQTSLSEGAN